MGKSKDKLDAIDLALPLEDAVAIFGHFLKYVVHDEDQKPREPLCSAFDIMMRVQKEVDSKALPARKPENNSKDHLYNALLTFFEDRQVKWHSSEVQQCGTALLKGLLDLLWYIDGHHHVFNQQSCPIPSVFADFQGFNRPELHGHRKRDSANMSRVELEAYCQAVYRCFLSDYWKRDHWMGLKPEVEQLVNSVSKYADSLEEHSKRMKSVHSSEEPVRKVSDCISYTIIASTCTRKVPGSLESIDKIIKESLSYEPVHVNEHCPNDAKHRYQFLQAMKGGLSIPVVHLMYKFGNNVGDLHYIWHGDPSEKDTSVLERRLHVVEKLCPMSYLSKI